MKTPQVALVGCGAVGDLHLQAIGESKRANCSVLFDMDVSRASAARARYRLHAHLAKTLEGVAEHADCAIVAVPSAAHAEVATRLLEVGMHVLAEKPLATSAQSAREMIETASSSGRVLACGLVRRFFGNWSLAQQALRESLVGAPRRVEVREAVRWCWNRAAFKQQQAGGGVLMDTGPHILDMLLNLLGSLELVSYEDDVENGVEASARVQLRCQTAHGSIPVDMHLARGVPGPSWTRIVCSDGTLELSPQEPDYLTLCFGSAEPFRTRARRALGNAYRLQLDNFVGAVLGTEPLCVPASSAVGALELIDQCYRHRVRIGQVPGTATEVRTSSRTNRRTLVTGAAGQVGSRLVEMWVARGDGDKLRCLIRGFRNAERLMRYSLDVVEADVLDVRRLRNAAAGCDTIVHLAAGEDPGRETAAVLRAAREVGVRRLVHLSTACVYGLGIPKGVETLQEDTPVRSTGDLYAEGKAQAEREVVRAVRRGLDVVTLRPQVVYGPGMRWSGELAVLLARGEIAVVDGDGVANLVYIDDLVRAIDCALEARRVAGSAFFLTDGHPVAWAEYIDAHAAILGLEVPRIARTAVRPQKARLRQFLADSLRPIPALLRTPEFRDLFTESPLLRATAFRLYLRLRGFPQFKAYVNVLKGSGHVRDQNGSWNRQWLHLQLSEARLSSMRAAEGLGFRANIGFEQGLSRTAQWLRWHKLAPPEVAITDGSRNPR